MGRIRTPLWLLLIVAVATYVVTAQAVADAGAELEASPDPNTPIIATPIVRGPIIVTTTTTTTAPPTAKTSTKTGRTFVPAFLSSLMVIILAELGDKTFFIAAIGALKNPRLILFLGAYGALFVMTILSTVLGYAAGMISHTITHWLSVGLFLYFGVTLLRNGCGMPVGESEGKSAELKEVEEELEKGASAAAEAAEANKSLEMESGGSNATARERNPDKEHERTTAHEAGWRQLLRAWCSPVFVQFFVLTFLAEWGDRSQIATVTLAATDDPLGVTLGALLGHALCTGLAVLGGKVLATSISERTVTILGGATFLVCAIWTVFEGFSSGGDADALSPSTISS